MRKSLAILVLALACAGPAAAGGIEDANAALKAYGDGDLREAIRLSGQALRSNELEGPRLVETYNLHGLALHHAGYQDRAIAVFDKALELKSDFVPSLVNRCVTEMYRGNYDRAVEDCTAAVKAAPTNGVGYVNRGVAYEAKGLRTEAVRDYLMADKLMPNHPTVLANLRRVGVPK